MDVFFFFIPHSGSSSCLLRTTSPFSHFFSQLQCYQVGLETSQPVSQSVSQSLQPAASCKSFIHFFVSRASCVVVLLLLHWSHQIKNDASFNLIICILPLSLCFKQISLEAQDTGPVLTTLCSSPERFIINRLKYSHCGLLFRSVAPMSGTHRGT